jgi:Rrf2 family protein
MLTALRKGGYLQSIRGPKGGFRLARSPELITIAEVEECLEGESPAERQGDRRSAEVQALEQIARQAHEARMAVLRSTTLAQLLLERDRLRPPATMFYI